MGLRRTGSLLALTLLVMLAGLLPCTVRAAGTVAQQGSTNSASSPVSLSYQSGVTAGNLLVAVCSVNGAATITAPAGFSTAINEPGDPAQGIFYKVAAGNENSIACSFSTGSTFAIQIYELSGMRTLAPLDAVNTTSSAGSGSTASSGTVTTTNADDILLAAVIVDTSGGIGNWTGSFAAGQSGQVGGNPAKRTSYGSAYLSVGTAGSYTTGTSVNNNTWRGQIAAFKAAPPPVLSTDIVDGAGSSVAGPSVSLASINRSFACQTVGGTLGSTTQRIRVTNTTNNAVWSLSLAATGGAASVWSTGGATPNKYDFNDAGGSGCTDGDGDGFAGQLSINPAAAAAAPQAGCSANGLSLLSATAGFSAGNSVVLASASTTADYYCYWDITGFQLLQKIPASQPAGSYSLGLTITLVAS